MDTKLATKQIRIQQWSEIIHDRKASGLMVDEYCELHSLSRNQYYYWLREIKKQALDSCAPQLVELKPSARRTGRLSTQSTELKQVQCLQSCRNS